MGSEYGGVLAATGNGGVEQHVERSIAGHISDDDDSGAHQLVEQPVGQAEEERQGHDDEQGLMVGQSGSEQLVMDMVLVRLDGRTAMPQSDEGHAAAVEHGHGNEREGHEDVLVAVGDAGVRRRHGELQAEEGQDEPDAERPRVAHEDFSVPVDIAKHIII